jgi:hypothetical protein
MFGTKGYPKSDAVKQGPAKAKAGSRKGKTAKAEEIPSVPAGPAPVEPSASDNAVNALLDSGVDAVASNEAVSDSSNVIPFNSNKIQSGANTVANITLRKAKQTKTFILYQGEGLKGSVRFLSGMFPAGSAPETIEVSTETGFAVKEAKVKETKEERKARLAARTPQQIAADAQKRANKAVERANALAAKAAAASGQEPALVGQE